jgi:excisionase family DNA binding protein
MQELFTIQEVSKRLKLSPVTLYRYVETGKMQHRKIGRKIRFTNSHINDFLSKNDSKGDKNV